MWTTLVAYLYLGCLKHLCSLEQDISFIIIIGCFLINLLQLIGCFSFLNLAQETAKKLYSTEKLPNTVGENIRIVHIGDYDSCPCIGIHVSSTKEIGIFRITTTSYADGQLRIRFKLLRAWDARKWRNEFLCQKNLTFLITISVYEINVLDEQQH